MADLIAAGEQPSSAMLDRHGEVTSARETLFAGSHYKCMYCEGKPLATAYGTIEHVQPKSQEPLLAYEWQNWGPCCYWCNTHKGEERFSPATPVVDPFTSHVDAHLEFTGVNVRGRTPLGEWTVTKLQLSTFPALVRERSERMEEIQQLIEAAKATPNNGPLFDQIRRFAGSSKEYSRMARAVLDASGF